MLLGFAQWFEVKLRRVVLPLEGFRSGMLPRLVCLPFEAFGSDMLPRLIHISLWTLWSEMLSRLVALTLSSHWPFMKDRPLRLVAFALRARRPLIKLRPIGAIVRNIGSSFDLRPCGARVDLRPLRAIALNIWSLRLVSLNVRSLRQMSLTWQFIVRPNCVVLVVVVSGVLVLEAPEPRMLVALFLRLLAWIDDPFWASWTLLSRLSLRLPAHLNGLVIILIFVIIVLLDSFIKQLQ